MSLPQNAKVLIYLFGSLGDTLVAIPALRAVRRHFADAELILLQNTQSGNIVKASEVIPDNLIDGYLSYESKAGKFDKISGMLKIWRTLRSEKFDAVVYLVISERPEKSVSRDKLFFQSCGIKNLYGFHAFSKAELYPLDKQNRPAFTDHEAVRKLNRLELDGIKSKTEDLKPPFLNFSEIELDKIRVWLKGNRKGENKRLIAIAPGCKTIANQWSEEKFIEIGRRLLAQNFEIVVVGGKGESEIAKKMIAEWGEGFNAAGVFSVRESGALLSLCDFYIGLDTGTTHLAAAVGTRCFALYGERNNPGHWYPLGAGQMLVFHKVVCAGCREFACPISGHPCMNGISVESVWQNLSRFIKDSNKTNITETEVIAV